MYNKINKLVIVLCVKDACELCSNDIVIFLFISSHVPVVKCRHLPNMPVNGCCLWYCGTLLIYASRCTDSIMTHTYLPNFLTSAKVTIV